SPEVRIERQSHEGGIASGTPAHYDRARRVHLSRINQIDGARSRILHIQHAPLSVERVLILPSKAAATPIIDDEVVPAASSKILRLRVPRNRFIGSRVAVDEDNSRAALAGKPRCSGGVEEGPGGSA